jgi:hypothetical protein
MDGRFDPEEDEPYLGRCPQCSARIPGDALLIRYQSASDWPMQFADCPACRSVVHPC